MKTRVWKYGEYYFPQYKVWFFWKYIFDSNPVAPYGESSKYFKTKEEAVEYLKAGNWSKHSGVVWQSEKD